MGAFRNGLGPAHGFEIGPMGRPAVRRSPTAPCGVGGNIAATAFPGRWSCGYVKLCDSTARFTLQCALPELPEHPVAFQWRCGCGGVRQYHACIGGPPRESHPGPKPQCMLRAFDSSGGPVHEASWQLKTLRFPPQMIGPAARSPSRLAAPAIGNRAIAGRSWSRPGVLCRQRRGAWAPANSGGSRLNTPSPYTTPRPCLMHSCRPPVRAAPGRTAQRPRCRPGCSRCHQRQPHQTEPRCRRPHRHCRSREPLCLPLAAAVVSRCSGG